MKRPWFRKVTQRKSFMLPRVGFWHGDKDGRPVFKGSPYKICGVFLNTKRGVYSIEWRYSR